MPNETGFRCSRDCASRAVDVGRADFRRPIAARGTLGNRPGCVGSVSDGGRQVVGLEPSIQRVSANSGLFFDPRDGHSARVQGFDIVEQSQPGLAAGLTRSLSFGVRSGRQKRTARESADLSHLPLDRHPEVLNEVKPVGDLFGPRSTLSSGLGVEAAPIAADDFDLGMLLEPSLRARHGSDRQDVDDGAAFEIDDDRAIGIALLPTPIVDAHDPQGAGAFRARASPFECPQDGIAAGGHGEPPQQPFTHPSPAACPNRRTMSPRRAVRRANGATSLSTKVLLAHVSLRQRQRAMCNSTIAGMPWIGKSCRRRTCRLCRDDDFCP